jgi:carbon monoxide dehydrogenase subunit G
MQEYISKQQQIFRPAAQIFPIISNFTYLTPAVVDKVEEWQATEDSCSFKFKGFTVGLRIEEKVDNKHVKIVGDGGNVPMDFAFWIQLHQVSEGDTRIRLVLHAELNMMMRMMVGKKLQGGLDQAVEAFAAAFNRF